MILKNKGYFSFSSYSYIPNSDIILRDVQKSGYELRLCSSVSDCYDKGGCCLMLTFTYSNEHLPHIINPATMEDVPVFCREHIREFLNRLKIRIYRNCKGSYKYFFCMEYGKNTKRQHYHGLFMLDNSISVKFFVDTCRELWHYGWMFPSPYGNPYEAAKLRSKYGGASYASKYVCKDLSYYSLPSVIRLLDWYKMNKSVGNDLECKYIREFLPRIYQSNGIGVGLVEQLNNNCAAVFEKGVLNPLTKKFCPIPQYVLNKYFYKNVLAFDGRVGEKGNKLYDRILRCSVEDFLEYQCLKLHRLSLRYRNDFYNIDGSTELLSSVSSKLNRPIDVSCLCHMLSVYRYSRFFSVGMSDYISSVEDFFSTEKCLLYFALQCDTYSRFVENPKRCCISSLKQLFYEVYSDSVFFELDKLLSLLEDFHLTCSENRVIENERLYNLKQNCSVKNYPVNLC